MASTYIGVKMVHVIQIFIRDLSKESMTGAGLLQLPRRGEGNVHEQRAGVGNSKW